MNAHRESARHQSASTVASAAAANRIAGAILPCRGGLPPAFRRGAARLRAFRAVLTLLFAAAVGCPALAAGKPEKAKERAASAAEAGELFQDASFPKLQIEIPDAEMTLLRKARGNFGPQEERQNVRAVVREGAVTYTNVSLHLKGAAGSFRAIDDRPALTLNFSKITEDQRFHGLRKISLNNSVQDPTYVSEQVCREVFLQAGVPVPRAGHARVSLNGHDLGVYVLVEGWDKEFLQRHFKNAKGNLYDGGFLKDVDQDPAVNSGADPDDHSALKALAEAAKEPDPGRRRERLEKTLDVERFLTYMALEVMLWDWDGYPIHKNNWRIFHDRASGRMVFMPHGMDQMFWKPEASVLPPMESLVGRAVLEVPEFRDRYLKRLRELNGAAFNAEAMAGRVATLAAKVRPVLAQLDPAEAAAHDQAVAGFQEAIRRRGQSLTRQLARPIAPLVFNDAGTVALTGWEAATDFGKPALTRVDAEGPKGALSIRAPAGSSIGMWAASAWLAPGRYALAGRIKTRGIGADPGDTRPGAGLRCSLAGQKEYVATDRDWQPATCEFTVTDALVEVRFFCEFRGAQGEAWFDLDSLQLKRLRSKP